MLSNNTRRHFSIITLEAHIKLWNHQQKAQRLQKVCLFTVWKLKQEESPCLTSAGNTHACQGTRIFLSALVPKWPQKLYEYWFWSYKYILANKQMWNPQIIRMDCLWRAQHSTWHGLPLPAPPPLNVNHCCSCVNVVKTSPCQGLGCEEATPQQLLEIPVLPAADGNQRKYFLAHWSSLLYQIESVSFSLGLQCPPGSGLLVSPPSMFSRVKHHWILGWASFPPSRGGPTSLHCIWLSQGVDVLLMQTHGTVEWINDPTSNKFHTPLNTRQAHVRKVPSDFPFISSVYLFFALFLKFLLGLSRRPCLFSYSWNLLLKWI